MQRSIVVGLIAAVLLPGRGIAQHVHPSAGDTMAPGAHEMWMTDLGSGWTLMAMGQVFPMVTIGAPGESDSPLRRTGWYLSQPVLMTHVESSGARIVLHTTVNLEPVTQRDGELTFGAWGEGFIDSRHPHSLLHEAMLSYNVWDAGPGAFSISAGRGFVPFGTDDPMSRPVTKYPTNHHLSQILERFTLNAVYDLDTSYTAARWTSVVGAAMTIPWSSTVIWVAPNIPTGSEMFPIVLVNCRSIRHRAHSTFDAT